MKTRLVPTKLRLVPTKLRLVLLCTALLPAACATTSTVSTSSGPDETYTVSTTLVGRDTSQMNAARALERQGDYAGAIEALEGLYHKPDLDPELREEVLLKLGELHGNWMNANRDYRKASAYLQELLDEYPETQYRERAEQMLAQYTEALAE